MSLKDWLANRMYVTAPFDKDPFFHPRAYSKTKAEVVAVVNEILRELPQWKLEEYKEIQGRFRIVRWTSPLPFADDIDIYVVQGHDGITRLEMIGQTKVGKRDWGRNKRSLKTFLTRLDQKLTPVR
jgi:uncharacterized protein (DUF1499 family)